MRVLPVPGGPTRSAPRGQRAPISLYLSGFLRNETISCRDSLASSWPATSLNVTPVSSPLTSLTLDLPRPPPIAEAAPAEVHGGAVIAHGLLHAAVEPPTDEKEDHDGQAVGEQQVEPHVTGGVGDLAHHLDAMVLELLVEAVARAEDDGAVPLLRVARAGGEVELGVSLGLLDLGDLVLVDHGEEVGVADLLGLGVGESRVHGLAHGEVDDNCNEDVEQHRPSSLVLVHVHRAGTFRPWLSGQRAGPWVM